MNVCTFMLHIRKEISNEWKFFVQNEKISPVVVGLKLVILTRSFSGGFYLKLNNACSPK